MDERLRFRVEAHYQCGIRGRIAIAAPAEFGVKAAGAGTNEVERVNSRAMARRPLDPEADHPDTSSTRPAGEVVAFSRPLTVLVVAPTLACGRGRCGRDRSRTHPHRQRPSRDRRVERRTARGRSRCRRRGVHPFRCRRLQSDLHPARRVCAEPHRARAPLRYHPRARARRRVGRIYRVAHDRRAAAHHLVQGLSRAVRFQAALQQRDGARRARDRGFGPDRRIDRRALSRRARAHRGRAGEHRHGALRSGGGFGRRGSTRSAARGASSRTPR